MATMYCEEQEDTVDKNAECIYNLLTILLFIIIIWGVLRCVWLAKLIITIPESKGSKGSSSNINNSLSNALNTVRL